LKSQGAKEIYFLCTHGPLVPTAFQKFTETPVSKVVVTNSINHPETGANSEVLDLTSIFAAELKAWL
jgi:phosphoribosylpyrophosphate synthetase